MDRGRETKGGELLILEGWVARLFVCVLHM